jgi:hypothetical protein
MVETRLLDIEVSVKDVWIFLFNHNFLIDPNGMNRYKLVLRSLKLFDKYHY